MAFETHPDANLMSALLEGGLPERARQELLLHFAECARCRRWLVCAQAAQPAPAVARPLPARTRVAWETPLATAASLVLVAAGVWLALPRAVSAPASQPAAAAAAVAAPAPLNDVTPLASGAVPAPARPKLARERQLVLPAPAEAGGTPTAEAPLRLPQMAPPPPPSEIQPTIDFAPLMTGFLDQSPPSRRTHSQLAAFSSRSVPTTPSPSTGGAADSSLADFSSSFQGGGVPAGPLAPALGITLGWAISRSGQVLRSVGTDIWAAVPLVPGVHIHALSSSNQTIWAGGQANQLYVSTDGGAHWRHVALPNLSNSQAPISSIIFTDARHGTVTSADGQAWTTADGGASWASH